MPRKCSVWNCKSNYDDNKITVYGFPSDPEACQFWLDALPNIIINPTKNMGVCSKHWPENVNRHKPYRSRCLVSSVNKF